MPPQQMEGCALALGLMFLGPYLTV